MHTVAIWNMPMARVCQETFTFTAAGTFLRNGSFGKREKDAAVSEVTYFIIHHLWSLLPRDQALMSYCRTPLSINTQRTITLAFKLASGVQT